MKKQQKTLMLWIVVILVMAFVMKVLENRKALHSLNSSSQLKRAMFVMLLSKVTTQFKVDSTKVMRTELISNSQGTRVMKHSVS
jgi:beta-lactamase regulating signal transducer with metallopeptidase domain